MMMMMMVGWLIYGTVAVVIAGVGAFFSGRKNDADWLVSGIIAGGLWPLCLFWLMLASPLRLLFWLGRRTAPRDKATD